MGVIFGGIQVASAIGQERQYTRVTRLAELQQQGIALADALETEEAETAQYLAYQNGSDSNLAQELTPWYGPASMTGVSDATGGAHRQGRDQLPAGGLGRQWLLSREHR